MKSNTDFIAGLISYASDVKRYNSSSGKVRVDVLRDSGKGVMLIVQNMTSEYLEACNPDTCGKTKYC
jgi:hypothetical protein